MQNNSADIFTQICSKVSNKLYFQELMVKQQKFFDIQPYKIDKLYAQTAKKVYKQISYKYHITKEYTPQPNMWQQNQRKIFIWFIVCYFHQIKAENPFQANIDWESLAEVFFYKSSSFLKFQFLNIIKLKKRVEWTSEEDNLLVKATEEEGIGKWNEISKAIFFKSDGIIFKSPKHCRQRWLNHLDQNKNKGKWTDEEDYKIFTFVKQNGRKWSKIVQILNNTRTQHMVKNRFNSLLTKNRKNKKQKQIQTINKIIKILAKTLGLPFQMDVKPQDNYGNTGDIQQSNDLEIRQNIDLDQDINKNKKKFLSENNTTKIFNYEIASFIPNLPNSFGAFLPSNFVPSFLNSPEMLYYCPMSQMQCFQKQPLIKLQEQNQLCNFYKSETLNQNKIILPHKTKAVYIIQKNH